MEFIVHFELKDNQENIWQNHMYASQKVEQHWCQQEGVIFILIFFILIANKNM